MGNGGEKESEREVKQKYHHVDSCSVLLVLPHPGLQWWGSLSCSSGGTTFIQSKSRVFMGCAVPIPITWVGMWISACFLSQFATVEIFVQVLTKHLPPLGLELGLSCCSTCAYLRFCYGGLSYGDSVLRQPTAFFKSLQKASHNLDLH